MTTYRLRLVPLLFLSVAVIGSIFIIGQKGRVSEAYEAVGPVVARGTLEAPTDTVLLAGDPDGGDVVVNLFAREGQVLKKGDIVATLSNNSQAEVALMQAESTLRRYEISRASMISGYRVAIIDMHESLLRATLANRNYRAYMLSKSAKPDELKDAELSVSEHAVLRQRAAVFYLKEVLRSDLLMIDEQIKIAKDNVEIARLSLEQTIVRSPIDGTIVQIFTSKGGKVSTNGLMKIVNFDKLVARTEIDELHLEDIRLGDAASITLRGSDVVYPARVSRIGSAVKRLERAVAGDVTSTDKRLVQVYLTFNRPDLLPKLIGLEVRVVFNIPDHSVAQAIQ